MLNALKFKPQKLSVFDIKVLFIKSVKHTKVKKIYDFFFCILLKTAKYADFFCDFWLHRIFDLRFIEILQF